MIVTVASLSICVVLQTAGEPPRFAPPMPIRAGDALIDVTTGHAAPYVIDFDGDGVRDLLVGEFGAEPFVGETTGEAGPGHPWVAGKLRFYPNHGTDHEPRYEDFTYVRAGERDAQVPITCCVSFVPQFIDFTGDGIDDLVSGSYPGDIYFFTGKGGGEFETPVLQRNVDGGPAHATQVHEGERHPVHSITAELHDMDGDGDLDLVVGSRLDGCHLIENVGTDGRLIWAASSTRMTTDGGAPIGGWNYGSNVHFADWDGDGISDIVVGSEDGGVFWHRNVGREGAPTFDAMQVLIPKMPMGEKFLKLASPMGPSWRVKVHVVDYDGDGRRDLLVGDFGARHTRRRTLDVDEKAEVRSLDEEMDALFARQKFDAEDEARIEAIQDRMGELETHDDHTTGYVWFFRRLPSTAARGIPTPVESVTDRADGDDAVRLRAHGDRLEVDRPFPVTVVITVPDGWAASGNRDAVAAAGVVGLPASIEWTLPEGCRIASCTWQDADHDALYEGTFAVEVVIDATGLVDPGRSRRESIVARVRYQRCDKKSGVCILESDEIRMPVSIDG